jgi:hypothetical protein
MSLVMNGTAAWLSFRSMATIPLRGRSGIAVDVLGTCFFLPLIAGIILTRVSRRWTKGAAAPRWVRLLPTRTAMRSALFGTVCVLLVGVPVLAVLGAFGIDELPRATFVVFKATFAASLAACVTPLIVLSALPVAPGNAAGIDPSSRLVSDASTHGR